MNDETKTNKDSKKGYYTKTDYCVMCKDNTPHNIRSNDLQCRKCYHIKTEDSD